MKPGSTQNVFVGLSGLSESYSLAGTARRFSCRQEAEQAADRFFRLLHILEGSNAHRSNMQLRAEGRESSTTLSQRLHQGPPGKTIAKMTVAALEHETRATVSWTCCQLPGQLAEGRAESLDSRWVISYKPSSGELGLNKHKHPRTALLERARFTFD